MPEHTSPTEKESRNLSLKAAALAVTLTGALFVVIYLTATLPEKFATWQTALPAPGISSPQAEEALLRARYLHEAEVRPALIRAGWDKPASPKPGPPPASGRKGLSSPLTKALWHVRLFPEVHASLLGLLTETTLSQAERLFRFQHAATTLSALGNRLALGMKEKTARPSKRLPPWFAYYNDGPGKTAALYAADLAFAREMLPLFLADIFYDVRTRATPPQGETTTSEYRAECLARVMRRAATVLRDQRTDPTFHALAREFLASGQCSPFDRYAALPLLAEKPGLPPAEYCYMNEHRLEADRIPLRIDSAPRHYLYILNTCAPLAGALAAQINQTPPLVLGPDDGPGITLTRVEKLTPDLAPTERLYLLADTATALAATPAAERDRAVPVLAGTAYRHMKNQPVILPLDPTTPHDTVLLDWYATEGWKEGRTLLFSASGTPAAVARHWGVLHFEAQPLPSGKPGAAFMHPVSGHFMLATLPSLRGKSAAFFLGPVTGLWFGRINMDKAGWVEELYVARPEAAPLTAPTPPLTSPLLAWASGKGGPVATPAMQGFILGEAVRKSQTETYGRYYRVTLGRWLEAQFPEEGVSALQRYSFVDNAASMLREWKMDNGADQCIAIAYLWTYRNMPETIRTITDICSRRELSPGKRLHELRRTIGLPAGKELIPCY